MKYIYIIIMFLGLVITTIKAQSPSPAQAQQKAIAIKNAIIHVGDGTTILTDYFLCFEKGIITAIEKNIDTSQYQIMDAHHTHLYPGFILPNSKLGLVEVEAVRATVDIQEIGNINPNVRAIVAYNTASELIPVYRFNGVLIAEITPTGNFIAGSSSLVQLDAWNWEDALIKTDNAIHVFWHHRKSPIIQYDKPPEIDNDNEIKLYNETKKIFLAAKKYNPKNDVSNLKIQAIQRLLNGECSLIIHTNDANAIIKSYTFFKDLGVQNIILMVNETALQVLPFIKKNNIKIIVSDVHRLPESIDISPFSAYQFPVILIKEGIECGLSFEDEEMIEGGKNLGFIAGNTVPYGITTEQALKMITLNNAKILNIDKKYGSLEKGKSATFFISQGDALDMKSQKISHAFIDGREIILNAKQQILNEKYKTKYKIK